MKKSLLYITSLLLSATAMTSCDDDFARPPIVMPEAEMAGKENITIAGLKDLYWQNENNYAVETTVNAEGSDLILKARVISTDINSTLYNYIYLEDETGGMSIAARQVKSSQKLATQFALGQEVYINVSGLYAGRYAGLFQLGALSSTGGTTFLENAVLLEHMQANGLAEPELITYKDVTLAELKSALNSQETVRSMMATSVKISNVSFSKPGTKFIPTEGQDNSIAFKDADGNSMVIRLNRYCTFGRDLIPSGTGSIKGILGFFNNDWQLIINSIDDLEGFTPAEENPDTPDNPDQPDQPSTGNGDGTEAAPFNCAAVIGGATGTDKWVKGYIVGWVDGMTLSEGAKFNNEATTNTNFLIADNAEETNVANCVPVQLPTDVRNSLGLQAKPGNYKKEVMLKGSLEKYFGTAGLKSVTEFKIDGAETPDVPSEPVTFIDETFETGIPAGWANIKVSGDKQWFQTSYQNNGYASMTGYKGTQPPFDAWLLTPAIDLSKVTDKKLSFDTQVNGYGSKTSVFEVYVLTSTDIATATKTKLNPTIAVAPESGYSEWANSGDVSLADYSGIVYIGFRFYATEDVKYATWCVDNVKVGSAQ
ncbi:MAG: DUF5689 domain-containing protein [Muribaculaceae bacterium]